ncbi:hypothetical protein B0T16DRAFT_195016 [Cercophora newfieldiana]|uniref:Uncharacterized protein n=1 Tax=Cercophora newfieldiana TaxID=92897 RepID=A0AA39Y1I0_9PEZI|nr:hypothetical protein B0T16DRAFT_195016 [Cercophora newfieldiana]
MSNKAVTSQPASWLKHLPLVCCFLLSFLIGPGLALSSRTCYSPDGSTQPHLFQCEAILDFAGGEKNCCMIGHSCLTNSLCSDEVGNWYRGGCVDKGFPGVCKSACMDKGECLDHAGSVVKQCHDEPGYWFCGLDGECGVDDSKLRRLDECFDKKNHRVAFGVHQGPADCKNHFHLPLIVYHE